MQIPFCSPEQNQRFMNFGKVDILIFGAIFGEFSLLQNTLTLKVSHYEYYFVLGGKLWFLSPAHKKMTQFSWSRAWYFFQPSSLKD